MKAAEKCSVFFQQLLQEAAAELIPLQMLIIFTVLQACYCRAESNVCTTLRMASVDLWERNYNRSKVRRSFVHQAAKRPIESRAEVIA